LVNNTINPLINQESQKDPIESLLGGGELQGKNSQVLPQGEVKLPEVSGNILNLSYGSFQISMFL